MGWSRTSYQTMDQIPGIRCLPLLDGLVVKGGHHYKVNEETFRRGLGNAVFEAFLYSKIFST